MFGVGFEADTLGSGNSAIAIVSYEIINAVMETQLSEEEKLIWSIVQHSTIAVVLGLLGRKAKARMFIDHAMRLKT
jgi:hypothetical protein